MKNTKVSYKIKRENFENSLDITVDLSEIEKFGLEHYLKREKLLDEHYSFEVLSRFIVLPQKKTFKGQNNFDNKLDNKKKQL